MDGREKEQDERRLAEWENMRKMVGRIREHERMVGWQRERIGGK